MDKGLILFRHQGAAYGRTALYAFVSSNSFALYSLRLFTKFLCRWVTDGQYHTTGVLEVQASDPFLERVNQTRLTVRRGKSAVLTSEQLGVVSNLDYSSDQMLFYLVDSPQFGTIRVGNAVVDGDSVDSFTQADLLAGRVTYVHRNASQMSESRDRMKIRAALATVEYEGTVDVRIYPESYWQPLRVLQNQLVTVEEGTSFTIDPSALKIGYAAGVNPLDVTYIVHQPPIHGYLEVDRDEHEYEDAIGRTSSPTSLLPPEVHLFDQTTIDEHRLHYIQSGANQSSDFFVFDITNGVMSLTNITFQLAIIPKSIYLLTRPLEVLEGGHTALTASDLKIVTRYYADKVDVFQVVREPLHGSLQLKGDPKPITRFSYGQLIEKQVLYWHDGGEESNDTMEVVALAGEHFTHPTCNAFLIAQFLFETYRQEGKPAGYFGDTGPSSGRREAGLSE